jgi:hypothetical protein
MLFSLSGRITHCHRRAAECRELAVRYASAIDRQYYFDREQAWLTLARSYEFQERFDRMLNELESKGYCHLAPPRGDWARIKQPSCPTCDVQMRFQAWRPAKRIFVNTIYDRALFVCPNCLRCIDQLIER